jgi:hypothetical protein
LVFVLATNTTTTQILKDPSASAAIHPSDEGKLKNFPSIFRFLLECWWRNFSQNTEKMENPIFS